MTDTIEVGSPLHKIATIVAECGGADKDCRHNETFPCWMEFQDDMYCACLSAAEKIINLMPESYRMQKP